MDIIHVLRDRARKIKARIVLPEADEPRTLEAASYISREAIADLLLLTNKGGIENSLLKQNANMAKIEIVDIRNSKLLDKYINVFYELRKHKDVTVDEARKTILQSPLFFGALMVNDSLADGFVAGAINTTRDVARSVLWCIGIDKEIKTMSSSFVMILSDRSFGADGVMIYADCGIIPDPSARQLANIAVSASNLMRVLFDIAPRVAMLSYSTKGSGVADGTEKIIKAIEIVKSKRPDMIIDGEMQADAALVPEIAKIKAPESPLQGKSNVLIFPNLEAGNISYKLTQRLANARALGPLLHGLRAPCSDLSRGCSAEDIVDVVAVTALRHAYGKKKEKAG